MLCIKYVNKLSFEIVLWKNWDCEIYISVKKEKNEICEIYSLLKDYWFFFYMVISRLFREFLVFDFLGW